MRILNLYAGIGGNRKLWGDEHKITAVEFDPEIAAIYKEFFPNDNVIVADAHQYLLDHYKEFDMIWSSPPCPTHSDIRRCGVHRGQYEAKFPDMKLYEEIILLKHFSKGLWIVENVKPYYKPLIEGKLLQRHLFWSNFDIGDYQETDTRRHNDINGSSTVYGFFLNGFNIKNKRKILRNLVNPKLANHVLNRAFL